jgi:hypothetical protein
MYLVCMYIYICVCVCVCVCKVNVQAHCQIEVSIRLYFSIVTACHCNWKRRWGCQIGNKVIVTLTHDLVM